MSANPIWIAGYFGPVAGAVPVWIAPGDGTVPSAVQSQIVNYYAPVAGATAVWIAGFFAPPPAAIGATPIIISGWGGSGGGGGGGHSAEALAYLARTVGGNEGGNSENIATLIDGLVSDGVWAKLDALYVLAQQNQTDALLNLVSASYSLTPSGLLKVSPTFTAYIGCAFSASSYFNVDRFTVPSPNFTQNSASFGYWAYALVDEPVPMIGNGTGGFSSNIYSNLSGSLYARVNEGLAPGTPTAGTKGLYVADRSSPTATIPYVNGAALSSVASTSGPPTSGPFLIGSWDQQSAETVSAAFIGASLGAAGQLALYNRLRTYMTAVGVP